MKRIVLLVSTFVLLGASGCWRVAVVDERASEGKKVPNEWQPFVLWGLVPLGENPIQASEKCPGGISKVEMEHSFLNGLVSYLTFGLFSPMTVSYTCAGVSGGGQRSSPRAP